MDRREFLKLAGLFSLGWAIPPNPVLPVNTEGIQDKPNILILVYDAFSANNSPLYGYSRNTTPNLARLVDHAVAYHNNLAAAPFTTPGTGTMLTGVYPWTHRAFTLKETVAESF